jgi:hypothetical protein
LGVGVWDWGLGIWDLGVGIWGMNGVGFVVSLVNPKSEIPNPKLKGAATKIS